MQLFDLDGTILKGNATMMLYMFCIKENPRVLKYALPTLLILMKGKGDPRVFNNETYPYRFLADTPHLDNFIENFNDYLYQKIYPIFHDIREDGDLIATGSPEIVLTYLSEALGTKIIGTKIDLETGERKSLICVGGEKFKRVLHHVECSSDIKNFYYDGKSDQFIESFVERTHILKRGKIVKTIDSK